MPISLEGRHALAFCGASRVGKSTIARELAQMLGSPYVSFGDHVRRVAATVKGRTATREELQDIGQELVDRDLHRFCLDVFAGIHIPHNGPVIVDGLRHARVVSELHTILLGFRIHLIFLEADRATRILRGEGITESELLRMDSHGIEKDLQWLKSHADILVNATGNPIEVLSAIELWVRKLNSDETVRGEVSR